MRKTQYLISSGCIWKVQQQFVINLFDINTSEVKYIFTPFETHDVVQNPNRKNIGVAFGRRPPINESYIFDVDTLDIVDTFSAQEGYAFYGHGFWTGQNLIGTAEINLTDYSSVIVLRKGDSPKEIVDIISTNGFAIHSVEFLEESNSLVVAHNGDWYKNDASSRANLALVNLDDRTTQHFFFKDLPKEFGLQHFVKSGNQIYCLFRIPPEYRHDTSWTTGPLIKLDLVEKSIAEVKLNLKNDLDEFGSDGLSLVVADDLICATSQRGNSIYFWSHSTEELLFKAFIKLPSGVTKLGDDYFLSSANGNLFRFNFASKRMDKISNAFFTGSHHQFFEL